MAIVRLEKNRPVGRNVATGRNTTKSSFMDKRTLKKLIREAKEAEAQVSETALALERRASKVKQTARKVEARIKIQLGAEALRLAKGVISQTAFDRMTADAVCEIDEINQALCAAGLRKRSGKEDAVNQNAPSMSSEEVRVSSEKSARTAKIEVSFARVPPEDLRNDLKRKLKFQYDSDSRTWRGRAAPDEVAGRILVCNAEGILKDFLVDGHPMDLSATR